MTQKNEAGFVTFVSKPLPANIPLPYTKSGPVLKPQDIPPLTTLQFCHHCHLSNISPCADHLGSAMEPSPKMYVSLVFPLSCSVSQAKEEWSPVRDRSCLPSLAPPFSPPFLVFRPRLHSIILYLLRRFSQLLSFQSSFLTNPVVFPKR